MVFIGWCWWLQGGVDGYTVVYEQDNRVVLTVYEQGNRVVLTVYEQGK